jgi:exodeoxyribonuclease VII large subunit
MPPTFLTVPFKQKDEVKSLGARWDGAERQWFVPEGRDLAPFQAWLPAANEPASISTDLATPPSTTALDPAARGIPLSRLLAGVASAVSAAYRTGVWTIVEVLRITAKEGHVYLELTERDTAGRVVAKAQAAIWASTAARIVPEFERATGATLAAGIKLLVRAKPVFKPQFGLTLELDGIDPAYTLGDLEAHKREIRARLQAEGVFDQNRLLPAPWDFRWVLVIAPHDGAGLGDFAKDAVRLERHGLCNIVYANSRFQGEGAAREILATLQMALAAWPHNAPPDAVVIIRGGGAVNDLGWLNDYALARFICDSHLPVLTGIGHERDSTLLDEVAHLKYDTPSKVVAGIEQLIVRRAQEVQTAFDAVLSRALRDMGAMRAATGNLERDVHGHAAASLGQARAGVEQGMASVRLASAGRVHQARIRTAELRAEAEKAAREQLADSKREVPALLVEIASRARGSVTRVRGIVDAGLPTVLERAASDVRQVSAAVEQAGRSLAERSRQAVSQATLASQSLAREIAGQGPQKTLGRGFALVRSAGAVITDARQAMDSAGQGAGIEISFTDGTVRATLDGRIEEP